MACLCGLHNIWGHTSNENRRDSSLVCSLSALRHSKYRSCSYFSVVCDVINAMKVTDGKCFFGNGSMCGYERGGGGQ